MRPDSSGQATITCFYVLFKRVKPRGIVFLLKGLRSRPILAVLGICLSNYFQFGQHVVLLHILSNVKTTR